MQTRLFSLVIGIVYLLIGIVGLIPAFYTSPPAGAPQVNVTASYGYLLGQFPVNILHDAVHIIIGLAGLLAAGRLASARVYSQTLFAVYGLLTFAGFIPQLDTIFGLVPIFGSDTWLHAATAVIAAYFGFVAVAPTHVEPAPEAAHH